MSLFVATPEGKWLPTDVEEFSDIGRIRAHLEAAGFQVSENDELIISDHVIEVPALTALEAGTIPPVPVPPNSSALPPDLSETVQVAAAPFEEPFIKLAGNWKSIPALKKKGWKLEPDFPAGNLAYNRFWLNTGSFIIRGPQKWQRSVTTKEGMSETTAFSLGAELGLGKSFEKLTGKLTATFQKSFTVTKEVSVTETYSLDVPEGRIAIFTLWQLINEVVVLNFAGNEMEWTGWALPPGSMPFTNLKYQVNWQVSRARQATPSYAFDPHFFDA
jgi:hypothetical protein